MSHPLIRVWADRRESDWNSYWRIGELLRVQPQLAESLETLGVGEIDICPAVRPKAPVDLYDFEVFANSPDDDELACDEIHRLTGRLARPSAAKTQDEFQAQLASRLLYLRQRFELWDEMLPRFILGVDFDAGRQARLRAAEPEKWRLVDHTAGGLYSQRRVLPAILLQPSEKGLRLLHDLKTEFDDWYQRGFRMHPPLNAILDYRRVLERYGVDCNESYRFGIDDGWFPMDVQEEKDWDAVRQLCAASLPDRPGDLLLDPDNKPVDKYGVHFSFIALTDDSA
jgi:hypothetical protein